MRVALVVAIVLVAAAPAGADVTIGSSLTQDANTNQACSGAGCTIVQTTLAGRPLTAPSDGVITRWRVKAGSAVTPVRLRVIHRTGSDGAATASSSQVTPASNHVNLFTARLPIVAGDTIGLDCCAAGGVFMHADLAATTDVWDPPLGSSPTMAQIGPAAELLVNADVEPDGDGDGFGDETQDACPATAGAVNGCPPVSPPPPPPPPPAPNQPPTVRFRAPLSGTGVGPSVAIELDVADDSGTPVVSLFDDDGTICVLQAAPYSCTWRPTGADVGRATLLASAVDSAGLSTLGIVRVRVNRFAARLTTTAKRRHRRLHVTGRLVLPAVVTRAQGCSGKVTLRVRKVRRTVALTRRCTYAATLRVRTGTPRVRFGGNSVIAPT